MGGWPSALPAGQGDSHGGGGCYGRDVAESVGGEPGPLQRVRDDGAVHVAPQGAAASTLDGSGGPAHHGWDVSSQCVAVT